jgi:hypothetical protein
MARFRRYIISVLTSFISLGVVVSPNGLAAGDLEKAPPGFKFNEQNAVFVDFKNVDLNLRFDVPNSRAEGRAVIQFEVAESGLPIFDLIPNPKEISLNGVRVDPSRIVATQDPHKQSKLRIIAEMVQPGHLHTLELSYDISNEVTFSDGTVSAGFFMSDLSDREYWEQYGPTNYEFDQYRQNIDVELVGTDESHEIFANGEVVQLSAHQWRVSYPPYFTTSSFYFHLVKEGRFAVSRSSYSGLEAEIPLVVYGASKTNVLTGMRALKQYLEELEGAYGAFAHPSFTAYITESGGGMEYCGATVTSLAALGHETTHSWFARGVMPANGNTGWLDEAIASWRDNGYPRTPHSNRNPRVLGGFSPYRRWTTRDAYSYGAGLISDFDGMTASTVNRGMKDVIREMYGTFKRQVITVQMFQEFMESALRAPLKTYFDRYIYGKFSRDTLSSDGAGADVDWSRHPRPFTKEEWRQLR